MIPDPDVTAGAATTLVTLHIYCNIKYYNFAFK